MNKITTFAPDGNITMSSREIAELCEKRHDNVIRDIEKMLADIFGDSSELRDQAISKTYDNRGYVSEYRLPKDLTVTLITGYRADLRYKVVKRLEELEGAQKAPTALTRADLAQMVLDAENERQALAQRVTEQDCVITNLTPKAEAHDAYLDKTDLVNLRQAMRQIEAMPNNGIKYLKDVGHLFPEGKNSSTPKAHLVSRGYFRVKPSKPNQEGKVFPQTFVTPRGVDWLNAIIPAEFRVT